MSWIDKILPSGVSRSEGAKRATVPEGVWTKCIKCEAVLYRPDLERNANVCPKCEHHMRLGARRRLDLFLDKENREEVFAGIEPIDRLRFRDKRKYTARLAAAQKSTGERDALVAMRGTLHGMPVVTVAFEFSFHGGSMGQAVGEKFSQAAQLALRERIPLVCFSASGGARMQEALISLMQMAKTSAVIERMHAEGVPYISVLTDPIYGGVSASLALLGDLNIAEPEVRAGFAGPNIIEQTIRQKLPKGFQRSEFLLEHGAIDMIVSRLDLRDTIARIVAKLMGEAAPIVAEEEPPAGVVVPADGEGGPGEGSPDDGSAEDSLEEEDADIDTDPPSGEGGALSEEAEEPDSPAPDDARAEDEPDEANESNESNESNEEETLEAADAEPDPESAVEGDTSEEGDDVAGEREAAPEDVEEDDEEPRDSKPDA